MGKILSKLKDDEVRIFQKRLEYSESTKLVSRFGGMTIYARGDDRFSWHRCRMVKDRPFLNCVRRLQCYLRAK